MRCRLLPASSTSGRTSRLMTPVWSRPLPMLITAMMETTALLASPLKASRPLINPSMGRLTMTRMATTSTRSHSVRNRTTVTPMTAKTRAMSGEKGGGVMRA